MPGGVSLGAPGYSMIPSTPYGGSNTSPFPGGVPSGGSSSRGTSTTTSNTSGTTSGTTSGSNTSTTTTGYSGPNWNDLWTQIRGQLPTVNAPAREPGISLADRTAMNAGQFGQAKDQIGRQSLSALRDLRANLAERGISGGAAGRLESDIIKSGYGNLAGVRTAQATEDAKEAQRIAELNAQMGVTQRGQDISILGLNTNAALQALQGAIGIANTFGNRTTTTVGSSTGNTAGTSSNVGNTNTNTTGSTVNYSPPQTNTAQIVNPNVRQNRQFIRRPSAPLNSPPPMVWPTMVGGGLGAIGGGVW